MLETSRSAWPLLLLATLGGGCTFDRSAEEDFQLIGCESSSQCPAGKVCVAATALSPSRCVAGNDRYAVASVTYAPASAVTGPNQPLDVIVTLASTDGSAPPADVAGELWALGPSGASFQLSAPASSAGGTLTFRVPAQAVGAGGQPEGSWHLEGTFSDSAGRAAGLGSAPAFIIDRTPPSLTVPGEVRIEPATGSLAAAFDVPLSAAGVGSTLRLSLNTSEPVDTVSVTSSALALTFAATSSLGLFQEQSALVGPQDAGEGTTELLVTLTDRALNASTARAATITFDTAVPSLADAGVVLRLAPWGTSAQAAVPSTVLLTGAPENGTLFVRRPGTGLVVSRADVVSFTSTPKLIEDQPPLEVVLVDTAGNASAARRVDKAQLTVSPRDIGFDDPRYLEVRPTEVGHRLVLNPSPVSFDFVSGVAVSSEPAWLERAESATFNEQPAVVADRDRGTALAFGGRLPASLLTSADTLEWRGNGWSKVASVGPAPSLGAGSAMAYDTLREHVLLFQGATQQTWAWAENAWHQRGSAVAPPPRTNFAMAFDEAAGVVVLFGGAAPDGGLLKDTWEWNGLTWEEPSTRGLPPPRTGHSLVWFPQAHATVLVGGSGTAGPLTDTWAYDARAHAWSQADAGAISATTVLFDSSQHELWSFDSTSAKSSQLRGAPAADGGALAGFSWSAPTTAATSPGPAPGFFDDANERLVFQSIDTRYLVSPGGVSGVLAVDTTVAPRARTGHSIVYLPGPAVWVLFGGGAGPLLSDKIGNDWWCFSQNLGWVPGTSTTRPPARREATLVAIDGQAMLHGGLGATGALGDTWLLTVNTGRRCQGSWTEQVPSDPTRATYAHAAAAQPDAGRVLLWGAAPDGGILSLLWSAADGSFTAGPLLPGPARYSAALTWDEELGQLVGGGGSIDGGGPGTCVGPCVASFFGWDGRADAGWRQAIPGLPAQRGAHALVFDPTLRSDLLFGGVSGIQAAAGGPPTTSGDVWRRQADAGWSVLQLADVEGDGAPGIRNDAELAPSAATGSALLFSGNANSPADAWELKTGGLRPSLVFHLDIQRRIYATFGAVHLDRVRVNATAGGDGNPAGVMMRAFIDGRWQVPPSGPAIADAGTAAPASISLDLGPEPGLLVEGNRRFSVALTTLGTNDVRPSRLKVTSLDLVFDLTLP